MGVLLTKPKMEKVVITDKNSNLMYGYCSMQGWRIEMEDTHSVILNMQPPFDKWSFFGVFDGHNGDNVALKCSTYLLTSILETSEFQHMKFDVFGNPVNMEYLCIGIRRGFINFDEYLRSLPEVFTGMDQSGSTAICLFVTPRYLIFINCGDSRGMLVRNSKSYFLTHDHKPSDPFENARIIKAGGSVIADRVNGCLALSRSLGDFNYKKSKKCSAFEQLISADPTISIFEKTEDDQMIVLCCDGVWDVFNGYELCEYLLSRLNRVKNLGKIAEELVHLSFYKGSKDNISALIIYLRNYFNIDDELSNTDVVVDKLIKDRVKEFFDANPYATISNLIKWLQCEELPNLPPGGISAKQYIIEEEFIRLKNLSEFNIEETPDSLRKKFMTK